MDSYLMYFMAFMFGICTNMVWNYIYALGSSLIMVKATINDSLMLLAKNVQSVYEIHHLKQIALEVAEKDERLVEFHKSRDKSELDSLKNTAIRNFINSVPTRYSRLLPFDSWGTAMDYLDAELKSKKGA
jgi:hypothetical protein